MSALHTAWSAPLLASLLLCSIPACTQAVDDLTMTDEQASASGEPASGKPKLPKNIILMISDGMGFNHSLAASYYRFGHAKRQVYQHFPFRFAVSTWSGANQMGAPAGDPCVAWGYDPEQAWSDFEYVKQCPTDSAAAATAIATGEKTYNAAIGMDLYGNPVENVREAAEDAGKATGVVTTVPFSHATPAGFVAHNVRRQNYAAIANEMILSSDADVIMGMGNPWYTNDGALRSWPSFTYVGGGPTWAALLAGTAGADADGDGAPDPWTLIETREAFEALMSGPTPARVFGVPHVYTTLQQERAGDAHAAPYVVPLNPDVPTLAEMTLAALNVLDDDADGLFLMIEGGAVDSAAEANQAGRVIEEQIDFDVAVEAVVAWVEENSNWGETLLIVTADHESGYLLGPGSNPTWEPLTNHGAGALPGMQWNTGAHTNSLVPLFAKGDDGHRFKAFANRDDPVRGRYLDNVNIADVIFDTLGYE